MSNNGCGQLGAIQTRGTCWFFSILNGFILSEDGQKILYMQLKKFYKSLKEAEKAYFDDGFNAPCPMKNVAKTKEIYFWKFIDQYLCYMSGPREISLKAGKSASILGGMSLQGTLAKKEHGGRGAYPQVEIGNSNPIVIPRNEWVERVLNEAVENDNWKLFNEYQERLQRPYESSSEEDIFSTFNPENDLSFKTFCGT
jgi:hypothetical protein